METEPWEVGQKLWPIKDTEICMFHAQVRVLAGLRKGATTSEFIDEAERIKPLTVIVDAPREFIAYTFLKYFEDDLIILMQETHNDQGYATAAVGFAMKNCFGPADDRSGPA